MTYVYPKQPEKIDWSNRFKSPKTSSSLDEIREYKRAIENGSRMDYQLNK